MNATERVLGLIKGRCRKLACTDQISEHDGWGAAETLVAVNQHVGAIFSPFRDERKRYVEELATHVCRVRRVDEVEDQAPPIAALGEQILRMILGGATLSIAQCF